MSFNKTTVSKLWSSMTKTYKVDSKFTSDDRKLVYHLLSMTSSFCHITESDYEITVKLIPIKNVKKIRMICGVRKQDEFIIPIPKSKLLSQLFPKKISKPNKFSALLKASRNIIKPQIDSFRESISLPTICPLSGKKLTHWGMIHIDHLYPLSSLLKDWLNENNLTPEDITLKGTKNAKVFKDENYYKSWFDYHLNNAFLQPVFKSANLSKGNR